jgi:hypothetical protein
MDHHAHSAQACSGILESEASRKSLSVPGLVRLIVSVVMADHLLDAI